MSKNATTTKARCASTLYLSSVLNCAEKYCTSRQVEAGWETLMVGCKGVEVESVDVVRDDIPSDVPTVDCVTLAKQVFASVIEPTEHNVDMGTRSVVSVPSAKWDAC